MTKAKERARKLLAVAMSVMLVLALGATAAFAVGGEGDGSNGSSGTANGQEGSLNGGSITINNAVPGQTYKVYQILYLESYSTDAEGSASGNYAYKANGTWSEWLKKQSKYVSIDSQGYATWNKITNNTEGYENSTEDQLKTANDAAVAEFAKLAQKEAVKQGSGISEAGTAVAPKATEGAQYSTVTFTDLKLGYYLVDSSLGTLCSLDTTNPSVTIEEKNDVPTNVKSVQEDSKVDSTQDDSWGNVNDADISQIVNFRSTITAQAGAENYVFHDKMDAGLTFRSVISVTLNSTEVDDSNYEVITEGLESDDPCTFHVVFTQEFCDTLKANDKIVISYTATLNEDAVVGGAGNKNESKVEYGDESSTTTTPPSETITYTWSFDVLKYANNNKSKVLQGVEFVLLNSDKTKVATIVDGKLTGWTDVPQVGADGSIAWPQNATLTTNVQGKIDISGLDADTYYLRETKALAGYNILSDDYKVEIKPSKNDDSGVLALSPVTAEVENKSGSELPSTGGMGTTLLYVVGGILVVGAGVGLVVRRRMRSGR